MKTTTNYEISKKLKEAGYVGKTDLETMLDALPSVIERKGWGNDIYFKMNKNGFWYENSCSCDSSEYCPLETYYHIDRQKNESLADTAGRLLLLLHEKNLIKF